MFGYCAQLLEIKNDPDLVCTMIKHLKELMSDTSDYMWENVRNYHGVMLGHFERKKMKWQDTSEIQALRRRYAQRSTSETERDKSKAAPKQRSVNIRATCFDYNKKACSEVGDHTLASGKKVFHICSYCARTEKVPRNHRETECRKKMGKEKMSKNE